jgi:hypothetical protein
MANYYEETTISPRTFVPVTSRYADATVIYYTNNKLLAFKTYVRGTYPINSKDKYVVVSKRYEYRPDLTSNDAYGTSDFWWKILEANGLMDIWDFKAGLNIRIPANVFL